MITAFHAGEVALTKPEGPALPHVLLVLDQFPKTLGGGERVVLRLSELLPKYGFRVSILTFFIDPESEPTVRAATCPIYLLPLTRTYDLRALRGAFALSRFLREQQVRIVQTFFESSDIWAGFVTKALSDAKLIWSRRDMGILRTGKHQIAYRLLAGAPDAVFAVSEQVRRHCIEVDGIDAARVQTVYNGLNLADWSSVEGLARPEGATLIATVGNIRRVKGQDVLVRAAAIVAAKFPNVCFSVAGDVLEADYFEELKRLVNELGLRERFHFAGGVRDLRGYLARADIFVLPSRSEGFSNAIIEAMAAGLPVVATDVGGNAEAVIDGVTGHIVAAEDAEGLAAALLRLLAEPERAQAMGAAGNARAADTFTTDAMMGRIVVTFERLLT